MWNSSSRISSDCSGADSSAQNQGIAPSSKTGAAQVKQGTVTGITVMTPKGSGPPGVEASMWNAIFLPPRTSAPIVRKPSRASATLDDAAVRKCRQDLGREIIAPERRTPEHCEIAGRDRALGEGHPRRGHQRAAAAH
jgi:hypothetical protein